MPALLLPFMQHELIQPTYPEGKQPGGQLTTTSEAKTFSFLKVDGFMLMDNLRKQALKFGAKIQNSCRFS